MKIGVLSDTHRIDSGVIKQIVEIFKTCGVDLIAHCGDIEKMHFNAALFGDIPVICALVGDQVGDENFQFAPNNWALTRPGQRVVRVNGEGLYVGHRLSFEFLTLSERELLKKIAEIRKDHDNVKWLLSGHTHHQILSGNPLINFVNPGGVWGGFNGYEYAIINTDSGEIVFSRIPEARSTVEQFVIGVISDTLDVSRQNPGFWAKLNKEFKGRGVTHLIHCGNIYPADIGRAEFSDFKVFYTLRPDQWVKGEIPSNWTKIESDNPVVEINGYKFCVQLNLGSELVEQSEGDMDKLCNKLLTQYPEIGFLLCGSASQPFLEEGERITIVNPGAADSGRFATIALPIEEIAFAKTAKDPIS